MSREPAPCVLYRTVLDIETLANTEMYVLHYVVISSKIPRFASISRQPLSGASISLLVSPAVLILRRIQGRPIHVDRYPVGVRTMATGATYTGHHEKVS